uniref:Uncharacterized protein n=1 Tax=Vespula pensylvanica TaxID=30213 RepID=A0A834UDL1_VESPE|nr:hypothetical protein H0235_002240 [Vespula pensylvanica]
MTSVGGMGVVWDGISWDGLGMVGTIEEGKEGKGKEKEKEEKVEEKKKEEEEQKEEKEEEEEEENEKEKYGRETKSVAPGVGHPPVVSRETHARTTNMRFTAPVAAFVGQNAKLAWNAERFNHHYRSGSIAMAVLAVEKDGRDGRGGGDVGVGVGGGDGGGGRSTAAVALEFSGALKNGQKREGGGRGEERVAKGGHETQRAARAAGTRAEENQRRKGEGRDRDWGLRIGGWGMTRIRRGGQKHTSEVLRAPRKFHGRATATNTNRQHPTPIPMQQHPLKQHTRITNTPTNNCEHQRPPPELDQGSRTRASSTTTTNALDFMAVGLVKPIQPPFFPSIPPRPTLPNPTNPSTAVHILEPTGRPDLNARRAKKYEIFDPCMLTGQVDDEKKRVGVTSMENIL